MPTDDPSRDQRAHPDTETGPTRRALLQRAEDQLVEANRQAPGRTAEWILLEVLDCDRAQLHTHPSEPVGTEAARQFKAMVERRVDGEPLQHILGYTSFRGLRIEVSPDVMIPRPETEEVVGTALQMVSDTKSPRILDVGTGSGCIALAMKHERPDAVVHACDVSPEALHMAKENAKKLQLDICPIEADLFADRFLDQMPSQLHLLVANPPYIPEAEADTLPDVVREYDPDRALFTRGDPLRFYRALTDAATALCRTGAAVVLEAHADYAGKVARLLRNAGVEDVQVEADLAGRPRIVRGRRA